MIRVTVHRKLPHELTRKNTRLCVIAVLVVRGPAAL
jgi:hypothetical protein